MPGEQPETGHDCLLTILVLFYFKQPLQMIWYY